MQAIIKPSQITSGAIVNINGYKHAMVQIVAASIAMNKITRIMNAPSVDDTYVMKDILQENGCNVSYESGILTIDPKGLRSSHISKEMGEKVHGTLYLVPAFASRLGSFTFHGSGGCQIGIGKEGKKRPTSQVYDVLERFGVKVKEDNTVAHGYRVSSPEEVYVDISNYWLSPDKPIGPMVSGATKTAIIMGLSANRAFIKDFYYKTDVSDLIRYIEQSGHKIFIHDGQIQMQHDEKETSDAVDFYLTDCVSEVMTYITCAVINKKELFIKVRNFEQVKKGLKAEFNLLEMMGVKLIDASGYIHVIPPGKIRSVDIYVDNQSIQSDHQPFFALMLLDGDRISYIVDDVWTERFSYALELQKLGYKLHIESNKLTITPSKAQKNSDLNASDTRAAAVLCLAATKGTEVIKVNNVHHVNRGYDNFFDNLRGIGVDISEVDGHENYSRL